MRGLTATEPRVHMALLAVNLTYRAPVSGKAVTTTNLCGLLPARFIIGVFPKEQARQIIEIVRGLNSVEAA